MKRIVGKILYEFVETLKDCDDAGGDGLVAMLLLLSFICLAATALFGVLGYWKWMAISAVITYFVGCKSTKIVSALAQWIDSAYGEYEGEMKEKPKKEEK